MYRSLVLLTAVFKAVSGVLDKLSTKAALTQRDLNSSAKQVAISANFRMMGEAQYAAEAARQRLAVASDKFKAEAKRIKEAH